MFETNVYVTRRKELCTLVKSGLILFPGNSETPYNYLANTYPFRQDSNFLYFFGLDQPDLVGMIDVDENREMLFGEDLSLDDIIWTGPQPTVSELAVRSGVEESLPMSRLKDIISKAFASGRKIHFVKPYRYATYSFLESLMGLNQKQVADKNSIELVRAIVQLRSIKEDREIEQIERMVDVAYQMHTTAMKMAKPGIVEREIAAAVEGIALKGGGPVPFPIICSINGQTLHNHYHGNILESGRLLLTDAGAESAMHYTSDITRTIPVGGGFNSRQKEIYQLVLNANLEAINAIKPNARYFDVHLHAAQVMAEGLKDLGLMRGDMTEAVALGAHALFFPHGLGHMLGLDVHDMEGLGENLVGYDAETERSTLFGTSYLRLGRQLQPGFVITVEPGLYFIPELYKQWSEAGLFLEFINYDKVAEYLDFGGIRIEDDVLVTETGCRVLGKPIPKTIDELEQLCRE